MQAGVEAEEHAGRVGRFGEKAVNMLAEGVFEAKGDAARTATDAAGQVDKERMVGVDGDRQVGQLPLQSPCRHRIAEKEIGGVFVIDEVALRVGCRLLSSFSHRLTVVALMFDNPGTVAAQQLLFPLPGLGGHMHRYLEAEAGSGDTDGQAKVAGRTDGDPVVGKDPPGLGRSESNV